MPPKTPRRLKATPRRPLNAPHTQDAPKTQEHPRSKAPSNRPLGAPPKSSQETFTTPPRRCIPSGPQGASKRPSILRRIQKQNMCYKITR